MRTRTNRNLKGGAKRKDRARLRRALNEILRLCDRLAAEESKAIRAVAERALHPPRIPVGPAPAWEESDRWTPEEWARAQAHDAKRADILQRIKRAPAGTPGAPHAGFPGEHKRVEEAAPACERAVLFAPDPLADVKRAADECPGVPFKRTTVWRCTCDRDPIFDRVRGWDPKCPVHGL